MDIAQAHLRRIMTRLEHVLDIFHVLDRTDTAPAQLTTLSEAPIEFGQVRFYYKILL